MRILGVDPGSRDTGLAVIDPVPPPHDPRAVLVAFETIHRPKVDGEQLLNVPPDYLEAIAAWCASAVRDHDVGLLAVEGIRRPSWRVRGKVKPLDPTAIIGTGIVLGAILSRRWPCRLVVVPPANLGGGTTYDARAYPTQIQGRPDGRGKDKLRHARSAYDVAVRGRACARMATARGGIYA